MQSKPKEDIEEETDTAGSYYYDDAHGYEEFKSDEEEDPTLEEEREDQDEGADLSGGAFDVDLD